MRRRRPNLALSIACLAVTAVLALVSVLLPAPVAAQFGDDQSPIVDAIESDGDVTLSVRYRAGGGADFSQARSTFVATLPAEVEVVAALATAPVVLLRIESADLLDAVSTNPLVVEVTLPPSAATFAQQHQQAALNAARPLIGAEQMHEANVRGAGQVIAVIDSGVDSSHPDLQDAVVFERCEVPIGPEQCPDGTTLQTGPGAAADGDGHGTNIAGILTGDGGVSPLGVAPEAQLEVYRVGGPAGLDLGDALLALDFILANRPAVKVINFSIASNRVFAGPCPRTIWPAFSDTVDALRARGTIVVAPTGNSFSTGQTSYPACLASVISVAGTSTRELLRPSSNIDGATDVAAPADNLLTTALGGGSETSTGTSFAVPVVAACAALVLEESGETVDDVVDRLAAGPLTSGRSAFTVPWLNCAPRCLGLDATVNLALGQTPTSGPDVILGSPGADIISAGQGDDVICAFGGDDEITAGAGDDRVLAGKGNDLVFGGPGNDMVNAQIGDDEIHGGDGDDRLFGSWGNDLVFGGPGHDQISGKAGRDELRGERGDDRIRGGLGDDIAYGGAGNDALLLGRGSDIAFGGDGDDRIVGYGGWDTMTGGDGIDSCDGGAGVNTALSCETGNDS
jgi:Ca2+-binding RTX toxin-like protein